MRIIAITLALWLTSPAFAQQTATIVDGDTVQQDGVTYRIHGIDAPEFGQKCGSAPCGNLAVGAMAVLTEGKRLECEHLTEGNDTLVKT